MSSVTGPLLSLRLAVHHIMNLSFFAGAHVGIEYMLRAQRGSHITTLRPRYILHGYVDPVGLSYI